MSVLQYFPHLIIQFAPLNVHRFCRGCRVPPRRSSCFSRWFGAGHQRLSHGGVLAPFCRCRTEGTELAGIVTVSRPRECAARGCSRYHAIRSMGVVIEDRIIVNRCIECQQIAVGRRMIVDTKSFFAVHKDITVHNGIFHLEILIKCRVRLATHNTKRGSIVITGQILKIIIGYRMILADDTYTAAGALVVA